MKQDYSEIGEGEAPVKEDEVVDKMVNDIASGGDGYLRMKTANQSKTEANDNKLFESAELQQMKNKIQVMYMQGKAEDSEAVKKGMANLFKEVEKKNKLVRKTTMMTSLNI